MCGLGVEALMLKKLITLTMILAYVQAYCQQALVQMTPPPIREFCPKNLDHCSMPITLTTNGNQFDVTTYHHNDGPGEQITVVAASDCDDAHFTGTDPNGSCPTSLNTWSITASAMCPGPTCAQFYHSDGTGTDSGTILTCQYPCVGGATHWTWDRSTHDQVGENYSSTFWEFSFTGGGPITTVFSVPWTNSTPSSTQSLTGVSVSGGTAVILQAFGLSGSFTDPITIPSPYSLCLYDDVHFNAACGLNMTNGSGPAVTTSSNITAAGVAIAHIQGAVSRAPAAGMMVQSIEPEVKQKHTVALSWLLSTSDNLKYQKLWRQPACVGTYDMRKKLPADATNWTDNNVKSGQLYCYYVTVTDRAGNTSAPSNIAEAQIP